jgi:uncharacterized protein (DUF1697 family)
VTKWMKSSDALARRCETVLTEEFSISVRCLVRPRSQIMAMVSDHPLASRATVDTLLVVHFCEPPLLKDALETLSSSKLNHDDVAVAYGALFQWCPEGISNSPALSPLMEKKLGVTVTARNWRTVTTIAGRLSDE